MPIPRRSLCPSHKYAVLVRVGVAGLSRPSRCSVDHEFERNHEPHGRRHRGRTRAGSRHGSQKSARSVHHVWRGIWGLYRTFWRTQMRHAVDQSGGLATHLQAVAVRLLLLLQITVAQNRSAIPTHPEHAERQPTQRVGQSLFAYFGV